jgi:transketolase
VAKERAAERASLPGRLAWRALGAHHATIGTVHLRELFAADGSRGERLSLEAVLSWDLFDVQPPAYRDQVLPPGVTARLGVELGVEQGWHRYVRDRGDILAIDRFGASAPAEVLLERYGFTVDHVVARAKDLLVVRHSA